MTMDDTFSPSTRLPDPRFRILDEKALALRLLSGSVLAPMGFHWATNGLGYAFSWLLIRTRDRRREKHRREVRARLDERRRQEREQNDGLRRREAEGESGGVE